MGNTRLAFWGESSVGWGGSMALNWADLLAGAIGGAPCVYVGQPFDTVKTRLQTRPDAYAGMWNCLRRTVRGEGVTALWKGTSPALFVSVMENAVVRLGAVVVTAHVLVGFRCRIPRVFAAVYGQRHDATCTGCVFGPHTGSTVCVGVHGGGRCCRRHQRRLHLSARGKYRQKHAVIGQRPARAYQKRFCARPW